MATELKGQLYSTQENTRYDVFLDNLTPDGGGVDIKVMALSYSYKFDEKDVDAHLLLSNAKVVFRVTDPAQETVLENMSDAAETVYRLRILRSGVLDFVGFVLTDLLSIDDTSGDYSYTVTATDGVARLKTIDYDGGGPYYDDYQTVSDHIGVILSNIPLDTYYPANAEYYRINSTMWPEGLTASDATDQMKLIRCSYRAFRTIDRQGQVKFSSVYDVLLELCRAFGLRFMYSRGRYVFAETVDYTRTLGSITWIRYDQAGTRITDDVLATWGAWRRTVGNAADYLDNNNPGVTIQGGKITYLPPLRNVKWVYKHYSRQNTLPTSAVWTNISNPAVTIQNFVTATGLRLRISALASLTVSPPPGEQFPVEPVHVVVGMTLFVDGDTEQKILVRSYNVTPSGIVSYGDGAVLSEWVDGIAGSYGTALRVNQLQDTIRQINVLTPEVPIGGTLSLQFSVLEILKAGVPWVSASAEYTIYDPYMETAIEGSVTGQYNFSTYSASNTAFTTNSALIEKEVLLGDGPSANSFGRFEYEDGLLWENTTGWKRYAAGGYIDATAQRHGAMRAKNILALQDAKRFVLDSTLAIRDYAAEYMLYRTGRSYIMKSGTFDALADRWKGKWQEVTYFPNSVTDPVEEPGISGPTIGPGVPDTEPGPGGVVVPPDPPITGDAAPGINTVITSVGTGLLAGDEIVTININDLAEVPLRLGDVVVLTNQVTGQTQNFEVAYDSELGVPDPNQITPGATSVPYYGEEGLVWLIPDTGSVAVVSEVATADFPAGSYVQPEPQFTAQLQSLLRKEHYDFHLFDYDTSITTGFVGPFWRAGNRIGWGIRKVHFAFAQDEGATAVKVNLKYYDASGFRYTVATFNSNGLGGIVDAYADVAAGYYRVEVETITGTAPKGLTVSVQMIKNN